MIMKEELVQEIIDCCQKDRSLFYYFKDRYALMLLSYYVGNARKVSVIKRSCVGKLLKKPVVKNILKKSGNGMLTSARLDSVWPDNRECYLLSLDKWGCCDRDARFYNQTSRPGVSLVLQMNFSAQHDKQYCQLIEPEKRHPFECYGHPVSRGRHRTLAWARMDIDFDHDEALIEEIQNDWIRTALRKRAIAVTAENNKEKTKRIQQYYRQRLGCDPKAVIRYVDQVLMPHVPVWAEAMLSAVVWFLKEEIGIKHIFYHSFDTGCLLKRIEGYKPPKSIYSDLPE